jgi:hypothetical protein
MGHRTDDVAGEVARKLLQVTLLLGKLEANHLVGLLRFG